MKRKSAILIMLFLLLGMSCIKQNPVVQSLPLATTSVPTLPPTLTSIPTGVLSFTPPPLPTQSVNIPKDAWILYIGDQSINVIPATGGTPISIVENGTVIYYRSPSWSPRGDRIAFVEFGPEITTQINIVNRDGSGLRQLRNNTYYDPAWSPDGEQIAYSADQGLYVSDVDGSGLRLIASSIDGFLPSWSPDGKKLALLGGAPSNSIYGPYQLYLINSDGTDYHPITDVIAGMSRLSWSPDGKKIAFRSYEGCGDINIIDLESGVITNLTNNSKVVNLDPAWSPDGNFIAFSRASYSPCDQNEVYAYQGDSIHIIQVDGQGFTQITNARGNQPTWWPTMILRPNWEYTVTKAGDNLNIRELPSTSAMSLAKLPKGKIVKILEGPVEADGFQWWHVATSDNIIGWCAYVDGWFMFHDSATSNP
jgi:Tol biopolymer transport system component